MNQDEEHLRLLSIFHYVVAGCAAFFALFPAIYVVMGLFMVFAPSNFINAGQSPSDAPPAFVGWILVAMGGAFILAGWAFAILVLLAGRFLARRKHHTFCLVIAGIECLFMPFGTALGIFSIIVLARPSIKPLFLPAS